VAYHTNLQEVHCMGRLRHFFTTPQRIAGNAPRPHLLAAWACAPLKIGALMPSSRSLARAMAQKVDLSIPGMVVELGAGTGAVTRGLLEHIPPERLLVVEREPRLYTILHQTFPQLKIVRADAAELMKVLEECGVKEVCAIVSSLPLLSMPKGIRSQIEAGMASAVAKSGNIIQFTYGPRSPIPHDRCRGLRLFGKRRQFVVSNVPPAHVWVYMHDRRGKARP